MRPSPLRHPLAVLRQIIDMSQQQLADLAECARPTIQAIELRKLNLSEKLAQRIAYQTGVSPSWLLAGDVAKLPTCRNDTRFTKETFETEQASLKRPAIRLGELEAIRLAMITAVERLAANGSSAYQAGKIWLWTYKMEMALEALEKQFGTDRVVRDVGVACYPQMKKRRPIIQPIMDKFDDRMMAEAQMKIVRAGRSVQDSKTSAKPPVRSTKQHRHR